MSKKIVICFAALLFSSAAAADNITDVVAITPSSPPTYEFWRWDLKGQGSDGVLHGYVPHVGDVVEFYMRQVDCEHPDALCSFEIAIRKRNPQ